LAELEHHVTDLAVTTSDSKSRAGGCHTTTSATSSARRRKTSQKQRMIVEAPPGKPGVFLANRHDGSGTVVLEVKPSSALYGSVVPADKLSKFVI